MTTQPVYIDDIIGEVIQATSAAILPTIIANETAALGSSLIQQIRYSKSSFDELITNLAQADTSPAERFNKYPLIHLVKDLKIDRGNDVSFYGSSLINIIFIHQTKPDYKIEDRDAMVFKPVLYPLYYEFMHQLKKNFKLWNNWQANMEYKHSMIERPYWGDRKSKNILNDYVDAIEVQKLSLQLNFPDCWLP